LPGPLVSTAWLAVHIDDPGLRLFDCSVRMVPDPATGYRFETARDDYERTHLPGAGYLDVIDELSGPDATLPFMRPDAARFAAAMGNHGVDAGSAVVLYAAALPWATRVYFLLREYGHDAVAVLDGGFGKWKAEGRALTDARPAYPPVRFQARGPTGWFLDKDAVREALGAADVALVNALSPAAFRGEDPAPYPRAGRIPGSCNVFYQTLLDPGDGTLLPVPVLRERLQAAGVTDRARVINYCGGGIAATVDAFALLLAGHPRVSIYDGSMSEWARDRALPMETG
jgi:thiosulfate/3-mercaptopyruvate sulfurtransferase